jgi:superfamily II DNA or RNA helicase
MLEKLGKKQTARSGKKRANPPRKSKPTENVPNILIKRRRPVRDGMKAAKKKLSRQRPPEDMSLEQWQVALRKEYGPQQPFRMKNLGGEPIFSEFEVHNPQTKRTYRVAVRGAALGENYCSCPDFATNTLGTCKHIEFVLAKIGKTREAKMSLALGCQAAYSEVYLHYGAQREVAFKAGSDCPPALKALANRYFDSDNRLRETAYARFHEFMRKAADCNHDLRCYNDALSFIADVRDRAALKEKIELAFPRGIADSAWKKLLKVSLYPYQREGALFAAKAGRCLIADDMGLGKTIQAIAAVEILARHAGIERVLVVSPTSLKHQWQQEIEKFSGRDAVVVEGQLARRAALYASDSFYKLTNYDVINRDLGAIARWRPDLIVLDEAQRIKNWKTRTAQTVKQLDSKFAIVLTGTPLENRLEELHSIVEFVDRFRLGPMFRFLHQHQHVDDHGRVVGYRNLSNISQTLAPILVRRTKDKVLKELPERLEKRFFVPMTTEQMEHHEENRETVARTVHKWRKFGFLNEADQLRLRIALQNMRMSCDSTYLLDKKTDFGAKADELVDLLGEMFEEEHVKAVIFSQWLRMHELVARRLERRKWPHVLFHGGVPGPHRKELIRRFKEDPECRLFLSTDAGGVGLNLQNASAVINLDQPWNPAVLEQRIGRVHRLGQHRPVRVVHFIAQGTIEEGMLSLLAFKKSLFSGALDAGQDEVFMGGSRLKKFMESVEQATDSITQSMPQESQETVAAETAEIDRRTQEAAHADKSAIAAAAPAEQLWADVLGAGMSLLEKLGQVFNANQPDGPAGHPGNPLAGLIATDDPTGKPYLKLPLPGPEVMRQIGELLTAFKR